MATNLFVNGDLSLPAWEGWRVEEDSVHRVENDSKVFAKLEPVDSTKAIFQQSIKLQPGSVRLSFQYGAFFRPGEPAPERYLAFGGLITGSQGTHQIVGLEVADGSLRYVDWQFDVPKELGERLVFFFGVNTASAAGILGGEGITIVDQGKKVVVRSGIRGAKDLKAGPVLVSDFVLEPL